MDVYLAKSTSGLGRRGFIYHNIITNYRNLSKDS